MSDRSGWGPRRGRGWSRGRFDRGSWRGQGFSAPAYRGRDYRGGPYGRGRFRDSDRGFKDNQNRQWNKLKRETPGKRLSEEEIGVSHYISDHEGFNGIIKSRYSDFQVSEINEQGEVAKLTCLAVPEPPVEETVDEDEDLLLNKYNLEILPMETWDNINKLVMSEVPTDEKVEIDVTGMTKEQRTKIHDAVKKAFGESIVGSTITVKSDDSTETTAEKKIVKFERYRKGVRIDTRVKWMWPGEYLYFIVHKENCDTMDAAVRIAERLRLNIKPTMLGYAGTKDRRAKTSQWFSLRRVDPRRVAAAGRELPGLRLGNYRFGNTGLRLGMLRGNLFRIALRNVTAPDSVIDEACSLLQERGFVNYYGLQRFGSRRDMPTYAIGLKLLQGHFQEAIDSILSEREGELSLALQVYRAEGPAAGARALPRGAAHAEARLLRALARAPNDKVGALNKVSRNSRLLYLHSYQSLVWNRAASERLRRLGARPAQGDLVPLAHVVSEDAYFDMESDVEDDDTETQDGTPDDDNNTDANGVEKEKEKNKTEKKDKEPAVKVNTKVLTQEDVDSGKYSIFDIVLPLPGYNIEYPPNMKDYYEELLLKDNLTLELKHKYKSYSLSGAYRHLVVRPGELSWSAVRYSEPYADLILSDRDHIERKQLTGIVEDGKYKALLLTMTLPPSCYATMALRELLKVDTSCDNQALQNNYHKSKKGGAIVDGAKVDGAKVDDANVDGAKVDGAKVDGAKIDGATVDSVKVDEDADIGKELKNETGDKDVKSETGDVGEKRKLSESEDANVKKLKKEQ